MINNGESPIIHEYGLDKKKEICNEIMANDVAMVKVRLETKEYLRTIKSKRTTFSDKIATFGKLNIQALEIS